MAPTPPTGDSHQILLDSLDIALREKPFRSAVWKPSQRRNKNIKQIIGEAARREASVMATQNNSGTTTPAAQSTGAVTPYPEANGVSSAGSLAPNGSSSSAGPANIAQAAKNLSTLVLERNLQASIASTGTTGTAGIELKLGDKLDKLDKNDIHGGPSATYTNIESAPSLSPAQQKPYCDITGLPAPYTDPKTRLRYHNGEVFGVIRTLPQGVAEQYLAARGAHVVLK